MNLLEERARVRARNRNTETGDRRKHRRGRGARGRTSSKTYIALGLFKEIAHPLIPVIPPYTPIATPCYLVERHCSIGRAYIKTKLYS